MAETQNVKGRKDFFVFVRMGILIFVSHGTLGYVTSQRTEFMEKSSFAETFILKGCGLWNFLSCNVPLEQTTFFF